MEKSNIPDAILFQRIATGDREAFRIFFYRYYATLVRVLTLYSRDPEQVKDWIQEIYLSVWEKRAFYRDASIENSKAYVVILARNYAVKRLTKKRKTQLLFGEYAADSKRSNEDPESRITYAELQRAYASALVKLPPRTREVYCLNREEGISYRKIAEQSGTSVKTVEAQISRAIALLRRELNSFLPR
jgi:RNA polymerase sigma-70 factor, ECF subfamily